MHVVQAGRATKPGAAGQPVEPVPVSYRELPKFLRILVLLPPQQNTEADHALRWSAPPTSFPRQGLSRHWNQETAAAIT
ncbi:hypothetical protein [Streptosporangium sp. 'caverna']|uniref:hypothetical protein n=1 Tax=Streptosporangium sp. 'caverna' TaxID=2202249 RepID=UPI0013A6D879|nr:hypothetical protein [Streptosporangium sp. 'caverna']